MKMSDDDLRLMKVKLNLECVDFDENGNLFQIPGRTCDEVEAILVARAPSGTDCFFRADVSQSLRERVLKRPKIAFEKIEEINREIHSADIRMELWYHFETFVNQDVSVVTFDGDTWKEFDTFTVYVDGEVAAQAWSVRRSDTSAEIAVETKEKYRRHGFGKKVVAAWVNHQRRMGRVPLYCHRTGNLESKALAESLKAILFADVISYQ